MNKKRFDSEEDQDVSFLHTLVHQSCHIDNTDTSTSGVETGAPSEAVEDATEVVYNANEAAGNGPTIPTATEETLGLISTELSRMATEKETLMAYIRQMTDPEGSHGLAVLNLNQLVQWMMNEHERSTNDLRMQNNRREDEMYDARQAFEAIVIGQNLAMQEDRQAMILARREASELRIQNNIREDECYDARQVFEAIIVGQNLAMQEDRQDRILAKQEASELKVENSKLREAQEKYEELEAEWKGRIRYAQERAEGERLSADEARAGVESRISQLKKAHAEEISAAAFKSFQERNSIICSRRMVQDDLTIARSQVAAWEQRYEATVKNNNLVVKDLNGSVRRLELEVETTKELAESTERDLRKRLEEQGKEKDRKIGLLKDQQRKLTREVETLSGRLVSAEHSYQRLSDFVKEQKETDREERQYMKNSLNHDIKRLERVVEANEVTIQNLEGRIAGLESGQELEDLKAEARSHLHHCSNQIHNLTQQNQFLEQEIAGLKRTSENRDREIHQNKGQWIAEKTALEQALKQTKAASLRYQRRTVKKIRAARSDAKSARTEIDRFRREQTQTAEQYQNVVRDAVEVEKKSLQAQATEQYENAVRNAVEVAKKSMQEQFDGERRTYLENTKNETTKTEEGLRTEIGALKSQIDRFTQATEVAGSASAEQSPAGNTDESASLARELDEAHRLLEEIEEQGLPRICGERLLLVELNKARRVLALVKREVQEPQLDKHDLLCALSEAGINEKRFQQCDSSKRPVLLAQARAANEKLQALQKLLRTDLEVPKDAILEILQSPAKNETNGRQEVGDSNMADTSQMQNTTRPGASEITQPPRTPADVLATPQKSTWRPSSFVGSADNFTSVSHYSGPSGSSRSSAAARLRTRRPGLCITQSGQG